MGQVEISVEIEDFYNNGIQILELTFGYSIQYLPKHFPESVSLSTGIFNTEEGEKKKNHPKFIKQFNKVENEAMFLFEILLQWSHFQKL
jgi:hypothetical protein